LTGKNGYKFNTIVYLQMNVSHPSVEHLIHEIEAVNRVWKKTRNLFGEDSALTSSYRELKVCLQTQLLRCFPDIAHLVIDSSAQGEPLYSIRLKQQIAGRLDAAHMPVRVAKEVFTSEEIRQFEKK
jgi:hypothetical protein